MGEQERCAWCNEPTGKAGKEEDSLYIIPAGPLCENCFDAVNSVMNGGLDASHEREYQADQRIAALEAENARLRSVAEAAEAIDGERFYPNMAYGQILCAGKAYWDILRDALKALKAAGYGEDAKNEQAKV
jgi:hypothetical protein